MRLRYYFTLLRFAFILLVPLVLVILPANFFDSGQTLCLSRLLFDFECYACGISRACMHLIHLDFETAYAYNAASFIVLPLLAIIWVQWGIKEWKLIKRYRHAFSVKEVAP